MPVRIFKKRVPPRPKKKTKPSQSRVDDYLCKEPFEKRAGIWFRKGIDLRHLRLKSNRGYVLSSLTNLPKEKAEGFKKHLLRIGKTLDKFGISSIVPHRDTDPERFAHVPAGKVYQVDDMKVSHSGLVVADLTYATTGGGMEMEIAKMSGSPTIIMLKKGSYASRMIVGHPTPVAIFEYRSYPEAILNLNTVLFQMFGKPSKLRQRLAARQREEEKKEGFWD